jgi:uncharacterized protein (DUF2062 family)
MASDPSGGFLGGLKRLKIVARTRERIASLVKKGLSNREIALGIAMGNLIAFIPLFGIHTITAIGLAHFLRLNTFIVILGTQISNPLSYPFQLFLAAETGSLIMYGRLLDAGFSTDIGYYISHYVPPILIGSAVLGVVFSALSFLLVRCVLNRKRLTQGK